MTVVQLRPKRHWVERTICIMKVIRAEADTVHECEDILDDMQTEESVGMDSVMVTETVTGEL